MSEILLLEELAANAWPAAVVQQIGGWRLRYNYGVTRRANSVLPLGWGQGPDLPVRIALAEEFYARRGAPARFQLSPEANPDGLDAALEARGYGLGVSVLVQTAPLAALRAGARGLAQVAEQMDDPWLAAYCAAEDVPPAKAAGRREILARIGPPAGFARIVADGVTVAVGLGVVERGWLGVFSVATQPAARRHGLATALLGDLAAWAAAHGAERVYLQVFSGNAPALALYGRLGFTTRYLYWYREKAL